MEEKTTQYRTIIEIITEAEDENDAMDIAGEFLRGNIEEGVKMKCYAIPLNSRQLPQ